MELTFWHSNTTLMLVLSKKLEKSQRIAWSVRIIGTIDSLYELWKTTLNNFYFWHSSHTPGPIPSQEVFRQHQIPQDHQGRRDPEGGSDRHVFIRRWICGVCALCHAGGAGGSVAVWCGAQHEVDAQRTLEDVSHCTEEDRHEAREVGQRLGRAGMEELIKKKFDHNFMGNACMLSY